MDRKKQGKITVLLDPEEFDRFEAYCEAQGFKKSTLIARLIRDHLGAASFRGTAAPKRTTRRVGRGTP